MNTSLVKSDLRCLFYLSILIAATLASNSCLAQIQSKTPAAPIAQSSPPEKPVDAGCPPIEEFDALPEWKGSELHQAVIRLNVKNVETLLRQQADADVKDNYGDTPLISVVRPQISEPSILPPGVVPDAQTRERNRRRRARRDEAQLEILELLLTHGADVNKKNDSGETALFGAASFGYEPPHTQKLLSLLIQYKADVNVQNRRGFTALMQATENNRLETAKFLLAHGADASLKNCDGQTALSIAEANNFAEIARLLKER